MSDAELKFHFFGWNNLNTSDKIWGWFTIGEKVYNFWGPRGGEKLIKIKFKQFTQYTSRSDNEYEARKTQRNKVNKGYRSIGVTVEDDVLVDVEKIYPGFTAHLKKQMFIAKLSGTIMGVE